MDAQKTLNDHIEFEGLKKIGVELTREEYDKGHDRSYVLVSHPEANQSMHRTAWSGSLSEKSLIPYYCPAGWRRYAMNVRTSAYFWNNSSNMYHGLNPRNVKDIIKNGFKPSKCQHARPAVYLTPSIRYAAHPRYATILKMGRLYYQVVLQVRVLNQAVKHWKEAKPGESVNVVLPGVKSAEEGDTSVATWGETMCVGEREKIDSNFDDNQNMEFLYETDEPYVTPTHGLVVTGIMIRCLPCDPIGQPENGWWLYWAKELKDSDLSAEDWLRKKYLKHV
mmetsp:Transcript_49234/g.81831  ORF Transcript_49234/g.81831 Transcript_49234/m.81831 type:complete len:279 (+) Transcript_49234:92-928(+)